MYYQHFYIEQVGTVEETLIPRRRDGGKPQSENLRI